jgi:hypothetical protein
MGEVRRNWKLAKRAASILLEHGQLAARYGGLWQGVALLHVRKVRAFPTAPSDRLSETFACVLARGCSAPELDARSSSSFHLLRQVGSRSKTER